MNQQAPPGSTAAKLAQALQEVRIGGYATALPELSPEEKALIYHYTLDGSDNIKNPPSGVAGEEAIRLGQSLAAALSKLPLYVGPVYSAEWWNPAELDSPQLPTTVQWSTFLSSSTSQRVAREHLFHYPTRPKNCLLYIQAKTGRYVDEVSHRGIHGADPPVAEREVIFLPDTWFQVVAIRQATYQQTFYHVVELLEL